jgi:adenosylcobyric acid synthase
VDGLALLPVETEFATVKRTVRVRGHLASVPGPLAQARGREIVAYEIHMGRTIVEGPLCALARIEERSGQRVDEYDGAVSSDGLIIGTYLHGLLENDAVRHTLIDSLLDRRERGLPGRPGGGLEARAPGERRNLVADRALQLDRLADAVRASIDIQPLLAACGLG